MLYYTKLQYYRVETFEVNLTVKQLLNKNIKQIVPSGFRITNQLSQLLLKRSMKIKIKTLLLKRLEVINFVMMSLKLPSMLTRGPCLTTFSAVTVTLYLLP